MRTYNSNDEVLKDVVNGVLKIEDDIEIAFDGFDIKADIICEDIHSKGKKRDISCWNIICEDIKCRNIKCENITCWDIKCWDIKCWDIICGGITCDNINYYAICLAYNNITCKKITGRRQNNKHFVLDGKIMIGGQEVEIGGVL